MLSLASLQWACHSSACTFPQGPAGLSASESSSRPRLASAAGSLAHLLMGMFLFFCFFLLLGSSPLYLEALWGRRMKRNGSGICRKAKVESLVSLLKAMETYSGILQLKENFLEGYGEAFNNKVKADGLGLAYPTIKWENTCPGFNTTSWLHTVECDNSPSRNCCAFRNRWWEEGKVSKSHPHSGWHF